MEKKNKLLVIQRIAFWMILSIGVIVRFYRLGQYPGGMNRDEVTVAVNSYNLFHRGTDFIGNINPFYMADWGDGHSAMYVWLTQLPLAINSGVITPFICRLPQAVVSVLTLLAVYGIGKNTIGKNFGLISMFFVTISPWHIMMSRWGLDANLAPGFMIISFYFLIKALKNEKYILLAGLMYGLTLYTYAVTWIVVPFTLLLVSVYFLIFKKIKIDVKFVIAAFILLIIAIPPILFVLINGDILPDIRTKFFTIAHMNGYRGDEVSANFTKNLIMNLKQAYHLFVYQDSAGEPWEVIKPWGLFYDCGRVSILLGGIWLLVKSVIAIIKNEFSWELVFLMLVIGSFPACIVSYAHFHRISVLYIPLLFCGAYFVNGVITVVSNRRKVLGIVAKFILLGTYLISFSLFMRDYAGKEYKSLVEAYWGVGMDECIDTAIKACRENNLTMITVEKAAQWPKLLFYTNTTADEFTENVVYEDFPIPWSFTSKGILFQTRIDYSNITLDSVYIVYFTDCDYFKENFEMIKIYDWYVCIPRKK